MSDIKMALSKYQDCQLFLNDGTRSLSVLITSSDSCCNTIQYKVNIIGMNNSLLHSQLSMDFTVDFF